ncbi:MAG: hypothetical protein MJ097_07145 [Dorea sp.]|nr:hypothetical protein [Dorea sp.]
MMGMLGNVLMRAALVPVLLILVMCQGAMKLVVNMYSLFKWVIGILCGIVLIGTVIWFRQDYMRYVLVAIVEAAVIAVLTCGVFVEVLLGFAVKAVSEKIVGGF